jgi:hypothetical protein
MTLKIDMQFGCWKNGAGTSAFQSRFHISNALLVLTKFNGKYLEAF